MSQRQVDVLVFDGCPNVDVTLERVQAAITNASISAAVRVVGDEEAKRLRFLGSPTVRIDGSDIDPTAADRSDFGLQCRVYAVGGHLDGAPPTDWILSALRGEPHRADASASAPHGDCCAGEKGRGTS